MAIKEGQQVDTLPAQMYGWDGSSPVRIRADSYGGIITAGELVPYYFDYISLSPPSLPTTIVYKVGGSGGTTVATLTVVYSGVDIASVTRT